MKLRKTIAALTVAALLPAVVACTAQADGTSANTTDSTSETTSVVGSGAGDSDGGRGGGPGMSVAPSSVTTEEQLVELVQSAYGDAGLGLHRGHQPVEDVLDEVLTISHDELHVRMEEQGQNLAAVATDLGVDPQALIDALVDSWSPAIDDLLEARTITEEEADAYHDALEEAFTFRVTWDGEAATPTFSGLDA